MDAVRSTQDAVLMSCSYAKELLERYKNYKGRISASCDFCNDKNCIHNAVHLEINGFEKEYAKLTKEHLVEAVNKLNFSGAGNR